MRLRVSLFSLGRKVTGMGLELMRQSLPWSLRRPSEWRVSAAEGTPDVTRRRGLKLPPLRAVRARIAVLEFAAVVAGTDSAVDARLEKLR